MTRIKFCGLSRYSDIDAVNLLKPDYIGFVFAIKSKRYISTSLAADLKQKLDCHIEAVGVFVNEPIDNIVKLLNNQTIDIAQLHGSESDDYVLSLRKQSSKPIIKAYSVKTPEDVELARQSPADFILLDSGSGGTGETFDWSLLRSITRPFFLAGGLSIDNVGNALEKLEPFAVDVSSGIETNGVKDIIKMTSFVKAVRKE